MAIKKNELTNQYGWLGIDNRGNKPELQESLGKGRSDKNSYLLQDQVLENLDEQQLAKD